MWPKRTREPARVVVDEVNVDGALALIRNAADEALRDIEDARVGAVTDAKTARRQLEDKIREAKAERGKLESAVGTARAAGRRTGGRKW